MHITRDWQDVSVGFQYIILTTDHFQHSGGARGIEARMRQSPTRPVSSDQGDALFIKAQAQQVILPDTSYRLWLKAAVTQFDAVISLSEINTLGSDGGNVTSYNFDKMVDVTGASVPAAQDYVTVSRRDSLSLPAPYIMRNAGLTEPGHALKARLADNRWFEYAPEKVIDMTSIGASETRTGAENTAYFQEAVAYSLLRDNAPIYWPPGTYQHAGMVQIGTVAVPIIGAGPAATIMHMADNINGGNVSWASTVEAGPPMVGATLCGLRLECNAAGQTTAGHGIRGATLSRVLIRDVIISNTYNYGIGFQRGLFTDVVFDNVTILDAGSDAIDCKNFYGAGDGNRGFLISNLTVRGFNRKATESVGGVDIRAMAQLSNIAVFGPFPVAVDTVAIRFRTADTTATDGSETTGAHRSSITNFVVHNPGQAQGTGLQILGRNCNASNGVIMGCAAGVSVTGAGTYANVSNVQCIGQSSSGLNVSGNDGRFSNVRVIDSGNYGIYVGGGAGNQFFGCSAIHSTGPDIRIEPAHTAQLVAVSNITLSGEQTVDGVLTAASTVLVVGQTNKTQNGLYTSAVGAWIRDPTRDTIAEIFAFSCKITEGTVGVGRWYYCTNQATLEVPVGTAEINFVRSGPHKFWGGAAPGTGSFALDEVEMHQVAGSAVDYKPDYAPLSTFTNSAWLKLGSSSSVYALAVKTNSDSARPIFSFETPSGVLMNLRASSSALQWVGGTSGVAQLSIGNNSLGFYGAAPTAKPTGVAVSTAGIHAALVTLGLIAA